MTAPFNPITYESPYRYIPKPHDLRPLPAQMPAPSIVPAAAAAPFDPNRPLDSWIPPRDARTIPTDVVHLPYNVQFEPPTVLLHPSWCRTLLRSAMHGNALDLRAVTPAIIFRLDSKDLAALLHTLAGAEVKVQWSNEKNHCVTGTRVLGLSWTRWSPSNAAAVLAMLAASRKHMQTFSKIMGTVPGAVVNHMRGAQASLVTRKVLADAIKEVMETVGAHRAGHCADRVNAADGAGRLVRIYLEQHQCRDPEHIDRALALLLYDLLTPPPNTRDPKAPARLGVMFGVVFAGAFKHIFALKAAAELRHRMINSSLMMMRQTVGLIPHLGPYLQVGLQATQILFDYADVPNDYTAVIARFQGEFEYEALDHNMFDDDKKTLLMLEYLRATQLCNGQHL